MTPPEPIDTLEYFEERSEEIQATIADLAGRDAPTGDLEASQSFVSHYRRLLEEAGVRCREHPTPSGVHLAGDWGIDDAGARPHALISAHSDTVWPRGEAARRPPRVDGHRLFGPGVYDMRAGLALTLHVFRALGDLAPRGGRRLRVFVSADEERGSVDARRFMVREATAPLALVVEPPLPGGALKISRKGVGIYDLEIRGRAAHAGTDPHLGISAIDEFIHQALFLHSLRNPERGVTVSVGTVRGGTASNVIADLVEASIDLRFDDLVDGEVIDALVRGLVPGDEQAEVIVRGGIIFPPMSPTERSMREAARAQEIARQLGFALETGKSGGGSDGSFLASRGITVLDGVGLDGGGAHALDEHVDLSWIPRRAALLFHLALTGGSE